MQALTKHKRACKPSKSDGSGFAFATEQQSPLTVRTSSSLRGCVKTGGDIFTDNQMSPTFLIWTVSDPLSNKLQRSQIVKGWVENGVHNEKVFDVACSDGLKVDPITHRCPDNGAEVYLNDCSTTANIGASELKSFWKDPEFNSDINAFYFVRVLENPSCRWSTWDAVRNGERPRSDIDSIIQERAWSSPIWVKSF